MHLNQQQHQQQQQQHNTPKQYKPVCAQLTELESSRAKEYLLEFLEELRQFNRNTKVNKNINEMSSTQQQPSNLAGEIKCDQNSFGHKKTSAFNLVNKKDKSDLENQNDYIRVRDYLIEFLEEYKRINQSKTNNISNPVVAATATTPTSTVTQPVLNITTSNNNNNDKKSSVCPEFIKKILKNQENQPKEKVIKIQVRIDKPEESEPDIQVELEKEVENISNKAAKLKEKYPKKEVNREKKSENLETTESNSSSSSSFSSSENKAKTIIYEKLEPTPHKDIMRHVPRAKLDMLDSITLKKIRDQYKQDRMPYNGSSRRSLLIKNNNNNSSSISSNVKQPISPNKDINSLDRASRSSNRHSSYELLENYYKNSNTQSKQNPDQILLKLISPKYNGKDYDFEKDFQNHIKQADPYYKVPAKFPNLRLNI